MINQLLKPVGTLHIIFLTIFNIHKIKKIYGVRQMRSAHAVGCGRVVHVSRTRSRSVECNLTMKAWKVGINHMLTVLCREEDMRGRGGILYHCTVPVSHRRQAYVSAHAVIGSVYQVLR